MAKKHQKKNAGSDSTPTGTGTAKGSGASTPLTDMNMSGLTAREVVKRT